MSSASRPAEGQASRRMVPHRVGSPAPGPDPVAAAGPRARRVLLLAPLALAAFALAPALGTGFLSDDAYNSLYRGLLRIERITLLQRILWNVKVSLLEGRFFPLAFVQHYAVLYTFTDAFAYKLSIVCGVLLNLALFGMLVRRLWGDAGLATLAVVLTVAAFQFRLFFDPILALHGLMQAVMAGILVSLLALQRFLEGGGRGWLRLAAACFLVCALSYEIAYTMILLHLALIVSARGDWKGRLEAAAPFFRALGFCVGMSLLMRWLHYGNHPYIYRLNPAPRDFLLALAKQTSGALPLSYFLFDPSGVFEGRHGVRALLGWLAQGKVAGLALAGLGVAYAALRWPAPAAEGPPSGGRRPSIVPFGLMLAVLPGTLIAVSARYQTEIAFGKGYLPVYFQCFGVGLLLAAALRGPLARAAGAAPPRAACVVGAAAVAVVVGLSYRANCETVSRLVAPPGTRRFHDHASWHGGSWHFHRLNVEAALAAGLLEDVPENAPLVLANMYPNWHHQPNCTWFYAQHAGKVLAAFPQGDWSPSAPEHAGLKAFVDARPAVPGPPFRLRDVCRGRHSGFVVLERLPDGGGAAGGGLRLFVRHPDLFRDGRDPLCVVAGSLAASPGEGEYVRAGRELKLIRSGPDWALFDLRPEAARLDPDSIRVAFGPAARTQLGAREASRVR